MIFISGPRQCGKTTFAHMISDEYRNSMYCNWDIPDHKKIITENRLFYEEIDRPDNTRPLIVLDEIHKFPDWKNFLKGAFDRDGDNYKFLVTGSGRLDLYRKSGDSLAGRYFLFHLFPFTIAELCNNERTLSEFIENPYKTCNSTESEFINATWKKLTELSGFPDPFLSEDIKYYNIWSETYRKQLVREDVRDLTGIKMIEQLEMLAFILPSKTGSPISMNNLAGDLKVSFDSVKSWLNAFDNFYLTFRISPWSKNINRSIRKEQKLYFYDYASIKDKAARFENMVALELLRAVSNWRETGLGKYSLNYIRNKDGEEVDFLISLDDSPFLLIECKMSDTTPSASLKKFQKQLNVSAIQLVNIPDIHRIVSNDDLKICVTSAPGWLAGLP